MTQTKTGADISLEKNQQTYDKKRNKFVINMNQRERRYDMIVVGNMSIS